MDKLFDNNQVELVGEIVSDFKFNHEVYGEKFYVADFRVKRLSDNADIIPITISDKIINIDGDYAGIGIRIFGQFRSFNKREGENTRLSLSVFVREYEFAESDVKDSNRIILTGYICKEPTFRVTPLKREISDIFLAVNRSYGKADYVPCIAWGRNAKFAGMLDVGTKVQIEGRIQGRQYTKKFADGNEETRTAYEVSISRLEVADEN